jgi:hypothetical protein
VSYRVKIESGAAQMWRKADMDTTFAWLGVVVVPIYVALWIGGPIALTSWLRKRRQEATARQIALTDAIHGQLGAIVSPVVKKPLWGPWEIQMAVPFARPATVGRILEVAHETLLAAYGMGPDDYEVVLTPQPDGTHDERNSRTSQSAPRWLGNPRLAA